MRRDLVGHGVDSIRGQANIEHGTVAKATGYFGARPRRFSFLADDDLIEGLTGQQSGTASSSRRSPGTVTTPMLRGAPCA